MNGGKSAYAGATGRTEGGMRLRGCGPIKLDGVLFRPGVSYPADDPIVLKHRFRFRVAPFPPSQQAIDASAASTDADQIIAKLTADSDADPDE